MDLSNVTTNEMDKGQWTFFRAQWIDDMAYDLVIECGVAKGDSRQFAEIQFEEYVGQEGFTGRDENIHMKRDMKGGF
jgi:hypothetical protein